jgi:hypothetical protein
MSPAEPIHPDAKNSIILMFQFVIPSKAEESLFLAIMRNKLSTSRNMILKEIPCGMIKKLMY